MTLQTRPGHSNRPDPAAHIKLVVSDMDGTLLTPQKQVTHHTLNAITALRHAGVPVCLVSSRPASGIEMYLEALKLDTPYGALNGGSIFNPDRSLRSQLTLPTDIVQEALGLLQEHNIDAWLFRGHEWVITNAASPYVEPESRAIKQTPNIVPSFTTMLAGVGKITASSSNYDAITQQEAEIGALLKGRACVAQSAPFYLDITPPNANKGYALHQLADFYGIAPHEVACLGDMNNDLPMFKAAGMAIAMGQATQTVKDQAHFVTAANTAEGWSKAVTEYILPRAAKAD
ncbi:Cof-type HAD-IIB family hydrolase [Acetobacter orientalis]|uniref:Cof-type HAD-IIB family hydrolase n=1 Tax=Acetobacter orientalis TaxID=146474 RepID=UPI0039E8E6E8